MTLLLFVGNININSSPEQAMKEYLKKSGDIDEFNKDDELLINCITKNDKAICEWKSTNYLCYDHQKVSGCLRDEWKCIEMKDDWQP